MQVKCRNCDEVIPAESINIQEMLALCPACSHVFPLDKSAFARKTKAHKVKRPEGIQVEEVGEQLTLAYRRLYGPGSRFMWVLTTLGGLFYTIMAVGAGTDGSPPGPVLFIGALAAICWYLAAVFATTRTRIMADEHELAIKRGPLPIPFREDKMLDVADIDRVTIQQNNASRFPTTYVVAQLRDGTSENLVTSLSHEAARYVAHVLDQYLHETADEFSYEADELLGDADALPVGDGELEPVVVAAMEEAVTRSQQSG